MTANPTAAAEALAVQLEKAAHRAHVRPTEARRLMIGAAEELRVLAPSRQSAEAAGMRRAAEICEAWEGSSSVERSDDPCVAAACKLADEILAAAEKMEAWP